MIRTLVLALALLMPAAAHPAPGPPADDSRRIAMMKVLRQVGVEVGAIWPIGGSLYEVEAIELVESPRTGEITVTVRTKLIR